MVRQSLPVTRCGVRDASSVACGRVLSTLCSKFNLELLAFAEPLIDWISSILREAVIRSLDHGFRSYLPCQMPANYI